MDVALAMTLVALLAQQPAEFEVEQFRVELRVEPSTREVRGEATVELRAGAEPLARTTFALNELLEVRKLSRKGGSARIERGERIAEGRALHVVLDPPLASGAATELVFEYGGTALDPGENDSDWMGVLLVRPDEIRMSHQAQWHPIVPRDDRARSVVAAPFELVLDLPRGLESLGPGQLVDVRKSKGRELHRWRSERPVRASILAGEYRAQTFARGGLGVRALSFADHTRGAKRWGEDALESLATMNALFGPLDITTYGIGEMRVRNRSKSYNYEADGFSVYDGVLFDGRDPDSRKIVHEAAHLWFGGVADASGRGERFLTEGLAEFAAWRAVEARHGAEASVAAAQSGAKRYFGSPGDEHALADTDFGSPRYVQVAYAKGAFAARTLRAWIGDEAFDAGLRGYLEAARAKRGAVGLAEFLAAMRERGGEAVDEWSQDWLERPGTPRYSVELGEGGGVLVQAGAVYRNPLELELRAGKKSETIVVRPTGARTEWKSTLTATLDEVVLDPNWRVLFERAR